MIQRTLRLAAATLIVGSPIAATAQTPAPQRRVMTCEEGANRLEFLLDGKGGATLARIDGPDIRHFRDLHERAWQTRVVREDGVMKFHVTNARGALLSLLVAPKPFGRMTWNDPPGSKADILCEFQAAAR